MKSRLLLPCIEEPAARLIKIAWIKLSLGMELGLSPDDFVLDGDKKCLFSVSRSTRPEVEIWRTFSFSNTKINRKRPQVAEISCPIMKSGSRNRMVVPEF